jgi:hypothetical protein
VRQNALSTLLPPAKKHNKRKRVTLQLDNFEKDVLRKTIFRFYEKEELPTAKKLVPELRKKINHSCSVPRTKL